MIGLFKNTMSFTRLKYFENLDLLNEYLSVQKFPVNILYFRAAWNPSCLLTDQHIKQFAKVHQAPIIRVDSDVAPKIAQHYGVTSEPQFVFCYNGDEIVRQIGPNYDGLIEKYQKILQVQKDDANPQAWTPYGLKFKNFYQENLKNIYKNKNN